MKRRKTQMIGSQNENNILLSSFAMQMRLSFYISTNFVHEIFQFEKVETEMAEIYSQ